MMIARRRLSAALLACVLAALLAGCGGGGQAPVSGSVGRAGSISGRAVDSQGRPLANATVTLTGPARGLEQGPVTARTGPDGAFLFPSVPPGSFIVTLLSDGVTITVAAQVTAGAILNLVIQVVPVPDVPGAAGTGTIAGRVVNVQTGAAIPGARVTARREQSSTQRDLFATTDATGQFVLGGLRPGVWTLTAQGTGYAFTLFAVGVAADATTETDIPLWPSL